MTHYQGNDDEARALDAYVKLMRASESVTSALKHRLDRAGITHSQLGVLEALMHLGELCQSDLSAKLLKSSGNVTTVVDNLERRGLVGRRRNPKDRRFVVVSLTDQGEDLIRAFFPEHVAGIVQTLRVLTAEEQESLARLCRKLGLSAAG